MATYREDMRRAWERIDSFPTQRLQTRFGTIEDADLAGPGFRVIGPLRFGYFGSTFPAGATPADQADTYALLLDHVGVDTRSMPASRRASNRLESLVWSRDGPW
jgi:hypothetical protein